MSTKKESYYGLWWLPQNPEHKINGTLTIDELGKSYFFTIQPLEVENKSGSSSFHKEYKEVIGIATSLEDSNDKSIKLYNVKQILSSLGVLTKRRFQSEITIIGNPNPADDSNNFNTIMLFSQTWNWWFPMRGVEIEHGDFSLKQGVSTIFKQPDIISIYKDNDLHIYIYFRGNFGVSRKDGVNILVEPFLNIESKKGWNIKEAFEFKATIERFFMILWGFSHQFEIFELRSIQETNFKVIQGPMPNFKTQISTKINFEHFKITSQESLTRWLRINDELGNLMNTFFFAFTSPKMDINNKFLNYVFSLELYHRKRIKDRRSLTKSNERMYNKALEEVKGDTASWLRKILSADREIPLVDRLIDLVAMTDIESNPKLNKMLIQRIKDTRHYLVHLDEQLKSNYLPTKEIVVTNNLLTDLFLKLLKKELNVNEDVCLQ
jgi:hypothetical protein